MIDKEFFSWYQRHEAHLRNYTLIELLELAKACGFKIGDGAPEVWGWLVRSEKRLKFWDSEFRNQWFSVTMAQHGKDE